nr:hypothetical protein [Tanacetum cinerariifolium]
VEKPVDHTDYRSMIGSLTYVTSNRPDIMFTTCMCTRYQANPNEHHVSAVKRIFRYLKWTINLGVWYSKDSDFDLTAYLDADHARCHLDRKNYGFFYDKVSIYYDSKSAIAISCNPVQHTRTKHIDVRRKSLSSVAILQPFIMYVEYLKEFWYTAEVEEETKTITFLLSLWEKPLSFTQDEFISTIGLPICKDVVPLHPKETSLIPPSRVVNDDDTADKSLSRASVQPVTQLKAPTDLKAKKKRILPSSKPKSPYKVRVILPKKQVAETQHAEVTVATTDATKSLVASKLADEQVLDQNVEEDVKDAGFVAMEEEDQEEIDITSKDVEEGYAFESLSGLRSMPDEGTETLHASADKQAPLGHLHEELYLLYNKVNQLESSITKHVFDSIQAIVPVIVTNTLKEQLPGLLSDALKDSLPQLITDSIKSFVSKSIAKEGSNHWLKLYQMHDKLPLSMKKKLWLEKSSEEDTSGKKEIDDEPLAKKLKFLIPSSSIPLPTPLKSIMHEPPKVTEASKMTLDQFTEHLSKTTSSIFSPTPPIEPTPPKEPTPLRDSAKGKEVAITEEQVKNLFHIKKKETEHEAKKVKMMEEYNHLISFRVDKLPITKISYVVNLNKEATMKITRGDNPLNLIVNLNFRLKTLGFSEWLEVHALASKKSGKSNDMLV